MLTKLGFRNKFLVTVGASVCLLGLIVAILLTPFLEQKLNHTIEKRGVSLAKNVAFTAEHYVLEEEYLALSLILKDYQESDEDLVYIFVSNSDGRIVAHTFAGGFPVELENLHKEDSPSANSVKRLLTDEGEIIDIAVPLVDSHLGTIHVGISGEEIRQDVNSFVRLVTVILVVTLTGGAILAIIAAQQITTPLKNIAGATQKVADGDLTYRVSVTSNDEIGHLMRAFNDMVEKRQRVEQEREKLISELNIAFDEIKVLSGMLPICASCKKIRDDRGYWYQIESYIRDHSEADFTHGICPDCVQKLYPNLGKT